VATIQDVAKAAGVSAMTVSNVINDHPNVRRATREKVLQAMARLDYRVNVAARNLRKGRTGTIGLAVPGVNSAYYGELAVAIIAAAVRYDLRVSIEQTGALRENELEALSLSRNRLYDGLLLCPPAGQAGALADRRVQTLQMLGRDLAHGDALQHQVGAVQVEVALGRVGDGDRAGRRDHPDRDRAAARPSR
jgi:DNA-binding LacI/PurR family transcriptional regulator